MSVAEFYKDKTVFITGVTGFLGKVLLEKLLRSCPEIKKIFVLMRAKKGDSKLLSKVVPINGDIIAEELGISSEDQLILANEVQIVFHVAASVKFDENLSVALQSNVLGPQRLLKLAKLMKRIESFVHVSTAYANCNRTEIAERVYTPDVNPQNIIDALQWLNGDIDQVSPRLVGTYPNTYTFTKGLAEYLIHDQRGPIPVAIVRPSIIGGSLREPFPGWVDSFNGPSGMFVVIGKGLLRTMLGDRNATADIVPVDLVANSMICAAHAVARSPAATPQKSRDLSVFNVTSGSINRILWKEMEEETFKIFMRQPFEGVLRVPDPALTRSPLVYQFFRAVSHHLPARLMDATRVLTGRKPIVVRMYDKIEKSVASMDYFTSRGWQFSNHNLLAMQADLADCDKETFNFDISTIVWPAYIYDYVMGTKQHMLGESVEPEALRVARTKMIRLQRLSLVMRVGGAILFALVVAKRHTLVRLLRYALLTYIRHVHRLISFVVSAAPPL